MKNKFYISSLELLVNAVIDKSGRPINNPDLALEQIRENWRRSVAKKDEVYLWCDVGIYQQEELAKILHELPGEKYLIIANHDVSNIQCDNFRQEFAEISPYMEINDQGRKVVLSHYPFEEWNGYHEGYYHLYGYVRNAKKLLKKDRRYCVSCHETNFRPVTLDELIETEKKVKLGSLNPGDHFFVEMGEFIVLDKSVVDGYSMVATDYRYGGHVFDHKMCDYENSELDRYCEKELYPQYYKCFGKKTIAEHVVDLTALDGEMTKDCICRVRPYTADEARRYRELLMDARFTSPCWTCTASGNTQEDIKVVVFYPDGQFGAASPDQCLAVQVVCFLDDEILVMRNNK